MTVKIDSNNVYDETSIYFEDFSEGTYWNTNYTPCDITESHI